MKLIFKNEGEINGQIVGPVFNEKGHRLAEVDGKPVSWLTLSRARALARAVGAEIEQR